VCLDSASGLTPSDIRERFDRQSVLTELGFPLRATLLLILGDTKWKDFNDIGHRLTQEMLMLGLGGWVGLGGVWLGCEGCACEEGGYGYEACCDYLQVVSFRLSDI
jgi:hypothetical protein